MTVAAQQALQLPKPIMGFSPMTFLERGAAIPFTTPQLAGTRVRPGERVKLELLIPNPTGGRGVYILPWTDLQGLCRPSLHDQRLLMVIAERGAVMPSAIRDAAHDVAADGLAGRDAIAAARHARQAEQRCLLETNFEMLLALLRQIDPSSSGQRDQGSETAASLERRARAAVARVAPDLGLAPGAVARLLEELAAIYSPMGVGGSRATARIPILVAGLTELRQEATVWWQTRPEDGRLEAGLLAMVADLTLSCVRVALTDAQALTTDMRALLQRWSAERSGLAQRIARPEWLTDGWDRIIEVWRASRALPTRRDVLGEITLMLPVIPREAADWFSVALDRQEALLRHRRKLAPYEDWRAGRTVFDQIARNEQILAKTAVIAAERPACAAAGR
jgi:hypothetical protein